MIPLYRISGGELDVRKISFVSDYMSPEEFTTYLNQADPFKNSSYTQGGVMVRFGGGEGVMFPCYEKEGIELQEFFREWVQVSSNPAHTVISTLQQYDSGEIACTHPG